MHLDVSFVPPDQVIPPLWLEAALAARRITASQLARMLAVEVGTVSRWRRGEQKIARSRWIAVLAVLGLPADFKPPSGFKVPTSKVGRPRVKRPRRR